MGTILTEFGDAAYEHEGFQAHILDDGSLTSAYSAETLPRMIGQVVAACGCGWAGTTRYPSPVAFDAAAEEAALAEWEHSHARPILAQLATDAAGAGGGSDERDVFEAIARWFPYDGPYGSDSAADAAAAAAELVRYLNNATGRQRTLEDVPAVCRVLSGVHALVANLDQLLDQLARALRHHAGDPGLYDDRRDRPGTATAGDAVGRLQDARGAARDAAHALERAWEASNHLGHEDAE